MSKIRLGGNIYEVADCTRWRIAGQAPACADGHDVNTCATCPHRIARPAPPPPPSIPSRAITWARAEASLATSGPLDAATVTARLEACNACPHLNRVDGAPLGFCRACGCGQNARAELTIKATMPAALCPIGVWQDPHAPRAPLPPA